MVRLYPNLVWNQAEMRTPLTSAMTTANPPKGTNTCTLANGSLPCGSKLIPGFRVDIRAVSLPKDRKSGQVSKD